MATCGCAAGPISWLAPLEAKSSATRAPQVPASPAEEPPADAAGAAAAPTQDAGRSAASTADGHSAAPTAAAAAEDDFEVLGVLGVGTFGRVVRARSRGHDGRECALKIIEAQFADEREAIAHRGLDHPHIARFLTSFMRDGKLFIAAELCHGGELYDALSAKGRCSEVEGKALFKQIMQAVDYMHIREVVHRDLKLDNFLLEHRGLALEQNTLKLIDFGFATRFVPGRRTLRTKCGTEGFTAPEVFGSTTYDERCDVYSAGVLLHCLLCGKMPFKDRAQAARSDIHFGGAEVKKTLPKVTRRLIEWMLCVSPGDRPSANDVLSTSWMGAKLVFEEQPPSPMSSQGSSTSGASSRYELVSRTLRTFGKMGSSLVASPSKFASGVMRTADMTVRSGCRMLARSDHTGPHPGGVRGRLIAAA